MKKLVFLLTTSLLATNLLAQVTIGSSKAPNVGALLDLKENDEQGVNSTRGMLLPRVQLTTIFSLDDIGTSLNKDKHIGLTIYVPKEFENSCPGVYVWIGQKWQGVNTDASRAPDFITERDVDGNEYTAKIFNRKGCKGGTYWFTSNLRTTKKNDGTAFHKPLYFVGSKSYTTEYPFDQNNATILHQVKSKNDISTSTAPDKMITYYLNNSEVKITEDQFVTKFGLQYTYYMAHAKDGETVEDVKICPIGWKVPALADWVKVLEEVSSIAGVTSRGAPYLFESNDIYQPTDRDIFTPENMEGEYLSINHPNPAYVGGWLTREPKLMGGYAVGDTKNSGLNVYPTGNVTLSISNNPAIGELGLERGFGSQASFLEARNGAITMRTSDNSVGGGTGEEHKKELDYGTVRCIKVVE